MKTHISEDAYSLIHSLTPTEKSYFIKRIDKGSGQKLAIVFHMINKSKEYDRSVLDSKVGSVYANLFDGYGYIISSILRSMVRYRARNSSKLELIGLVSQIEVSNANKQHQLSLKLIERGLKIATKQDLHSYTYILLSYNRLLPMDVRRKGAEELNEINTQRIAEADNLLTAARLAELIDTLNKVGKRDLPTQKNRRDFFEKLIASDRMKDDRFSNAQSRHLVLSAMSTIDVAYFYYGDWERALKGTRKLLSSLPDVKNLNSQDHWLWVRNQGNVMYFSNLLLDRNAYLQARKALLDSYRIRNESPESIKMANLSAQEVASLVLEGNYDRAIEIFEVMLMDHSKFEAPVVDGANGLRLSVAEVLFMKGAFAESLQYIGLHLTGISSGQQTIVLYTKWIELLCIYELKDDSLFQSRMLSLKRFLKKADTGFDWESEILKALTESIQADEQLRKTLFSPLLKQLEENKMEVRYYFGGFDIIRWFKAKHANRHYGDFIRDEYMKGGHL